MGILFPLEATFETGDDHIAIPPGMLIILVLAAALTVLWIWMLIDALVRPAAAWRAAGRSPVAWALALIFLGWIGALLYLTIARPSLRRGGAATSSGSTA